MSTKIVNNFLFMGKNEYNQRDCVSKKTNHAMILNSMRKSFYSNLAHF